LKKYHLNDQREESVEVKNDQNIRKERMEKRKEIRREKGDSNVRNWETKILLCI
jgi:hypothetical protein